MSELSRMTSERPLSPHLAHYRWEVGQSTSIMHRATGIALAAGLPVLAWWIVTVAAGGDMAAWWNGFFASWPVKIALFGWTVAICFHLLNGLRHLGFDSGHGFGVPTARKSGWLAIVGAIILALIVWAFVIF
ncbi:succinate dehydrogenase, cytochrome b556 subunit [Qipengyuania gelatinilytica]|uniref:Succinate dehydrogenase cytochrome b556 subunit n=1 Tax=Qipengyuania gelatinilytica TaxID=2867231 RepID=A0ABX9A4K6_9SPHN|nr:succinate dehydrogenase, cytochrome b556 subunit [Qipengyuania gelatinilytica]QZD96200.1 succinate dehydrogenase, cytochrome b556 subunit [Qipengyuania gelatinilytica]